MPYILVAVMDKVQEALVEQALKSEPRSGPHIAPTSRRSDLVTDALKAFQKQPSIAAAQTSGSCELPAHPAVAAPGPVHQQ